MLQETDKPSFERVLTFKFDLNQTEHLCLRKVSVHKMGGMRSTTGLSEDGRGVGRSKRKWQLRDGSNGEDVEVFFSVELWIVQKCRMKSPCEDAVTNFAQVMLTLK